MTLKRLFFILCLLGSCVVNAQDTALATLPAAYLSQVSARVGALEEKLDQKSQRVLGDFQKSEEKIYRKLLRKDSAKAAQFLASSKEQLENPGKLPPCFRCKQVPAVHS